jgi:hypothetical protein
LWGSIFFALLVCDLIAITWYLWQIPETEFERWKKVVSALGSWLASIAGFFGIKALLKSPSIGDFLDVSYVRIVIALASVAIWLFILPFHSLTLLVTDPAGQPLAGVAGRTEKGQSGMSDPSGRLRFDGLLATPHRVQLAKTEYVSGEWGSGFADVLPWASLRRAVLERGQGAAHLQSTPAGAEILLDQDLQTLHGTTPHDLTLNAGQHTVRFRKAHYRDTDWEPIVIPAGGSVEFARSLQPVGDPRSYGLTVASDPQDADIYVDGRFRGRTPLELRVSGGLHMIEVKKSGYVAQHDQVAVPARSIATFRLPGK